MSLLSSFVFSYFLLFSLVLYCLLLSYSVLPCPILASLVSLSFACLIVSSLVLFDMILPLIALYCPVVVVLDCLIVLYALVFSCLLLSSLAFSCFILSYFLILSSLLAFLAGLVPSGLVSLRIDFVAHSVGLVLVQHLHRKQHVLVGARNRGPTRLRFVRNITRGVHTIATAAACGILTFIFDISFSCLSRIAVRSSKNSSLSSCTSSLKLA